MPRHKPTDDDRALGRGVPGNLSTASFTYRSRPRGRTDAPPSVLLALQRATHTTLQEIAKALVDLDLTSSEINALANLEGTHDRTVSQLGASMGIRPTTLTSVLDRLERRGHITRANRAGDRRAVVIGLTASGRATASSINRVLTTLERHALRDVTPRDVEGFHAVVAAFAGASP